MPINRLFFGYKEVIKMSEYRSRIVDEILSDKLEAKGAVVIVGPKW